MTRSARRESPADVFEPAWWLPGRHAQTLWPALARRQSGLAHNRERLELRDGDFLELFWGPPRAGPIVLLLHGLGGCALSPYVLGIGRRLTAAGYQALAVNYRGAAAQPNRLRFFYHAGNWPDAEAVMAHAVARFPGRRAAVVGFSLGGAIALNWLEARGAEIPLTAAAAVSVPFDLAACAREIDRGTARFYQRDLLTRVKGMYRAKFASRNDAPIPLAALSRLRTLRDFDEHVTAPLHGFANAADYYHRCSPGRRLSAIDAATLLVQARDDPFVPEACIPPPTALPESVTLAVSDHGGHVGFVAGQPWRPRYWAEERIIAFLDDTLGNRGVCDEAVADHAAMGEDA